NPPGPEGSNGSEPSRVSRPSLSKRFVAELLTTEARLEHQATLGCGEHCDARPVLCVGCCARGQRHCARLSGESEVASFELGKHLLGFEENNLGVRLTSELEADG